MGQGTSMVADPIIGRAVSAIVPNSDKQLDLGILQRTFVDLGILAQLDGSNSQIVFGRRGTGKSHLLRLLALQRARDATETSVYVDVRNLGSAQVMTDLSKSLTTRAVTVFRDLLGELQGRLVDLATDPQLPRRITALESVSALADSIAAVSSDVNTRDISASIETSARSSAGISGTLSATPGVRIGLSAEDGQSSRVTESYTEALIQTIDFTDVSAAIAKAVDQLGISRFTFIVDEWSSIPEDIQPYIAEFLRRTIFPIPRINLKFSGMVYRSAFSITLPGTGRIGLEFGGEITRNIDLDAFYTVERSPSIAAANFGELLWHHLTGNLDQHDYLQDNYAITTPLELRNSLFAADGAFEELLLAAGGVPRDFLSLFYAAYFRAAVDRVAAINVSAVRGAVAASFQAEKLLNLDAAQRATLAGIARQLQIDGGGRLFLVEEDIAARPMFQSLFDLRVVHLAQHYYTDSARPGGLFAVVALDYGASLAMGVSPGQNDAAAAPPPAPEAVNAPLPDLSSILR
jgi:hypothetical protein